MKNEIANVSQAMRVNLEHLDNGGSIKEIPNVFETIVLESPITESIIIKEPSVPNEEENPKSKAGVDHSSTKKTPEKNQKKSESFWALFMRWLSSPWNVSWRTVKKHSKEK